jgi:hypothetical protein
MNVQKKKVQQSRQVASYGPGRPDIYNRVEKERERLKNVEILTRRNELKIIYKYWVFLKRYYLFKKMIKNQKMKLKSIGFELLKYNYLTNYQKYGDIVEQFDLRKKAMIFYMLYDEHIIKSKKRYVIKQKIISSFNLFLGQVRNQIGQKYNNYSITQRFYFNIFINKALYLSRENNRINQNITMLTNYRMKNAYYSVIKHLQKENYIKKNLYAIPRKKCYILFFEETRKIINQKYNNIKKIFDFRLKYGYKNFSAQIKRCFKERNKAIFVNQFYEEKLQRKALSKIKAHLIIVNNFRKLVIDKYLYEKEKIKEKTGLEVYKKYSLIQKYREYKQKKLVPIKRLFFKNTKRIIEHKKMNVYAREYAEKNLRKKIFIEFGKYALKNKLFKIFLLKFQKIYKNNIKRDYINLMQYKVHKFLNQNGQQQDHLPHAVGYYISQKFNNQLINLKIYEMASFIKKCKKIIINKKKEKNKILAADIFYSKLLKIKVLERFNLYIKYIQIKKRYASNVQKKYINSLKTSLALSKKEKQYREKIRQNKGKTYYQKFFIGLILVGGVNIYNHRKKSMRNIIINQILKNEEINNADNLKNNFDNFDDKTNISSINNKLACLILFKLILFIVYRKLFDKLKLVFVSYKYKNVITKKYIKCLQQAKINQDAIKAKMNKIKDDILNLNQ